MAEWRHGIRIAEVTDNELPQIITHTVDVEVGPT
jgi:hypothetical protein